MNLFQFLLSFTPNLLGIIIALMLFFIIGWLRNSSRIRRMNINFTPKKKDEKNEKEDCEGWE